MSYKIKSIYNDPELKHRIEESWEASTDTECFNILKDFLDVPYEGTLDCGFDAYAEKMRSIGFEDEDVKQMWDKMVAVTKHYQDALDAILHTEEEDGSTPWKEGTPYVIDLDDYNKIYITVC